MANPPTDRLVKAEIRFTWNDQQMENVMHFRHAIDVPDEANMTALAEAIRDEVEGGWAGLLAANCFFREVYVESYAGTLSSAVTVEGSLTGSAGGEAMPGGSTFCLSLRTAFVGRARRGRFYTIGMSEAQQAGGIVNSAYRVAWLAAMNSLMVATAAISWELSVASFVLDGNPRSTALVTPVQTIIAVDDYVDSQRRRLQGRGK